MANEKRLIDANALITEYDRVHIGEPGKARKLIADAPTIDAVEVVRCRECKYSTLPSSITQKYGVPGTLTCHNRYSPCNNRNVSGEGFCPYGERKDGDGNG